MLSHQKFLLIASVTLLSIAGTFAGQNWAVLVAGSNEWYNYRHQSDVCHAYQILHKNGIPDSNIVVMMYDDIANDSENPTPGVIINHPKGKDVYAGVLKDYTGDDVTPKNFLNVLLGNKEALKGVGSGKVIESGPDDNVFVYFTDHGATNLVAFPNDVLYAKDLNKTLVEMHTQKKYKELVIYIEACESGSMLHKLPDNMNIYATTASNPTESSYACYYDEKRGTYLGDLYSVNWMEDSDAEDISTETLFHQFQVTKETTNLSHVMEYGDLKIGKSDTVSQFQGAKSKSARKFVNLFTKLSNKALKRDAVAVVDVRESILRRRLAAAAQNSVQQANIQRELTETLQQKSTIFSTMKSIAQRAFQINGDFNKVMTQHMELTKDDCYISATQHIHKQCFDLQNEYVLNRLFIIANLCEMGVQDFTIKNAVNTVCTERQNYKY